MMTKEEARERIAALSEELEQHNYNYYILAKPTISDYEFDMMLEELARLCRRRHHKRIPKREASLSDAFLVEFLQQRGH